MPILPTPLQKNNPASNAAQFGANVSQAAKGLSTPGVQADMAMRQPSSAMPTAVQDFGSRLKGYNSWSKQMTAQTFATQQARRAAEASRVQRSQQTAQQQTQQANTVQLSGKRNSPQLVENDVLRQYSAGASPARQQIVSAALSHIGTPYAWGGGGYGVRASRGTGKGTQNVIGVDCSGLVAYAYGTVGVKLPHYSGSQTAMGHRTNIRNAMPGDIVGWNKGGHVAVYLGNGMIAEAPNVGKTVRTRKLGPNEAVYAVRLKLQGE